MAIVSLKRVNFVAPLGALGDTNDASTMAMSTAIASAEWLIESDYHHGSIGDVTLYRNINVNVKGSKPDWRWYAAIPTANIKAYVLLNPPEKHEPEAETPTKTADAEAAQ